MSRPVQLALGDGSEQGRKAADEPGGGDPAVGFVFG
jgi:hypothetical protein